MADDESSELEPEVDLDPDPADSGHDSTDEEPLDDEWEEDEDDSVRPRRAPWHFKVLLAGTVVYLGWRVYQGIGWLVHHI